MPIFGETSEEELSRLIEKVLGGSGRPTETTATGAA